MFRAMKSTKPPAPEEAPVCCILPDIGRLTLLCRIMMMLGRPHRRVLQNFRINAFFPAIGWGNGRHVTRHDQAPRRI
jgi:hypothetical protein